MDLSDTQKEMLAECKDSLQRNDLAKTYDTLRYLVEEYESNYRPSDIGEITTFFESKGIHIGDFLDYIPDYAFFSM